MTTDTFQYLPLPHLLKIRKSGSLFVYYLISSLVRLYWTLGSPTGLMNWMLYSTIYLTEYMSFRGFLDIRSLDLIYYQKKIVHFSYEFKICKLSY